MSYFSDKFLKAVKQIRQQLDEKHIHNFRLGIKHLKALWIFREWVTGKRVAGPDRKQIRKAFKRSGILRDIQVRQNILEEELHLLTKQEKADISLGSKKARKRFTNQIRKKRLSPEHLASQISKWTKFVDRMSEEQLLINGESFYLRGMERLHHLASRLPGDPHAMHQIRKEIKHLIYIGQFLEDTIPGCTPWQARLLSLIDVSSRIGEWHDLYLLPVRAGSPDPSGQDAAALVEQARIRALQGIDQLLGLEQE